MKSFFSGAAVMLLTFAIGVAIVSLLFTDLFWYKPFGSAATDPKELRQTTQQTAGQELTFESWGGIADGMDFSGPACYTSHKASDGAMLNSLWIYNIKTETRARNRFNFELRHASRVVEKSGDRAIVEKRGAFILVSWGKTSEDPGRGFSVSVIDAPSLKHILDFEKQQNSFTTSLRIDRLNP